MVIYDGLHYDALAVAAYPGGRVRLWGCSLVVQRLAVAADPRAGVETCL